MNRHRHGIRIFIFNLQVSNYTLKMTEENGHRQCNGIHTFVFNPHSSDRHTLRCLQCTAHVPSFCKTHTAPKPPLAGYVYTIQGKQGKIPHLQTQRSLSLCISLVLLLWMPFSLGLSAGLSVGLSWIMSSSLLPCDFPALSWQGYQLKLQSSSSFYWLLDSSLVEPWDRAGHLQGWTGEEQQMRKWKR